MWTSEHRLYLDAGGKVVSENDSSKVTLLVCAGGQIPMSVARKHGLVAGGPEAKAVEIAQTPAYVELSERYEKLLRDFDVLKEDHAKYKAGNNELTQQITELNHRLAEFESGEEKPAKKAPK